MCVECKDTKKPDYAAHYSELLDEMNHLNTEYGVLIQHRKGLGLEHMDGQMAIMSRDMLDRFTAPFATSPIPAVVQMMAKPHYGSACRLNAAINHMPYSTERQEAIWKIYGDGRLS